MQNKVLKIKKILTFKDNQILSTFEENQNKNGGFSTKVQYVYFFQITGSLVDRGAGKIDKRSTVCGYGQAWLA